MADFVTELTNLINKHSMENGSDTPDFILANYLQSCLDIFNTAIIARQRWYKPEKEPETEKNAWQLSE